MAGCTDSQERMLHLFNILDIISVIHMLKWNLYVALVSALDFFAPVVDNFDERTFDAVLGLT